MDVLIIVFGYLLLNYWGGMIIDDTQETKFELLSYIAVGIMHMIFVLGAVLYNIYMLLT